MKIQIVLLDKVGSHTFYKIEICPPVTGAVAHCRHLVAGIPRNDGSIVSDGTWEPMA